ncbi:SDR family oxidoreductase [Lactobacillus sp. UCMA15818]|uniref:SDR family NAD(P)-dependent oxidoreductase n=1 Tax=Lactobacillus sp. UCMA15818 TaxID=2583394 RepID=UPI0025AEFE02|nr:SDR family oxidoreductase [Lactobacillus sp. UCMA15818]
MEVADTNKNISYYVADLSNSEAIKNVIQKISVKFNSRIDILVNSAGWCPVKSISEMTIKDYDMAFDIDVRGLVDITIHSLPLLKKAKGVIINLSSAGLHRKGPNLSMYLGAKAAIEAFTKVWALELASSEMRVNAITPGAIKTPIWTKAGLSDEEARNHEQATASSIPVKRMGNANEVANVALFLASEEASYVTGAIYSVDGGMSI